MKGIRSGDDVAVVIVRSFGGSVAKKKLERIQLLYYP